MTETHFPGFTFINNHLTCFFFNFAFEKLESPCLSSFLCQWGSHSSLLQNRVTFPRKTEDILGIPSVSTLGRYLILILQYLCLDQDLNSKTPHKRTRKTCRIWLSLSWIRKQKCHFLCNLGFILFSSNQTHTLWKDSSFLTAVTVKTMTCLNVIKWRILSLLWASLDVARLPEQWSLTKKNCSL